MTATMPWERLGWLRRPRRRRSLGRGRHGVILCAGRGSRLGRLTADRPKCLLEVGGLTLLERQLSLFERFGIGPITVVTGYGAQDVERAVAGRAETIHNDRWHETNSIYSFWLCRDAVRSPVVVLNCDILLDPKIFRRVLACSGSTFAYDSSSGTEDEQMSVEILSCFLAAMDKRLASDRNHGENVGLLSFDLWATHLLFRESGRIVGDGGSKQWLAAAVERVAESVPIYGTDVVDLPWIEIDFAEDLERARSEVWPAIRSGGALIKRAEPAFGRPLLGRLAQLS